MAELVGVQPLVDIIALTIQTGFISNELNSCSLLLIAKPETVKTTTIGKFSDLDYVAYFDEITAKKLIDEFFPLVKNNKYKFLLIPDLINCIEKQKATRDSFLALIKSGIDDTGVKKISTYHKSLMYQDIATGIKFGLISAITSKNFNGIRREMINTGLLSRFIPFSYDFGMEKISQILNMLNGKKMEVKEVIIPKINKTPTDIPNNPELFSQLNVLAMKVAMESEAYGFRTLLNLQRLAKASALINGRKEVMQEDIDKIIYLSNWINLNYNMM